LAFTETATYAPYRVTGTEASDPVNHETSFTSDFVGQGVTVSTQIIQIGNQVWVESTPPGGGWHEETTHPAPPFPLLELVPYLVDVHALPGKVIDGHQTVGEAATLDAAGVAYLVRTVTGIGTVAGVQDVRGITFDVWVGPAHHVREIAETETVTQGGQSAEVFITTYYRHWGEGIHLAPPTVAG